MWDYYLCYPAILTNTLVPQPSLSLILQNQLGVALDALTDVCCHQLPKRGRLYVHLVPPLVGFGVLTTKLVEGLMCLWELQDNAGIVWGSPGLGGVRIAELPSSAGLQVYEDTRLKTSSRVRMGLSLAWKASLAIRICRSPTIVSDSV